MNAELSAMYPEPGATHFRLNPEEGADGRGIFLVVYREGAPVGRGALRLLDAETAELKRMYVAPGVRGKALGRHLLDALEAEARALGILRNRVVYLHTFAETGQGRTLSAGSLRCDGCGG